ncbi:MAG: hypothetical protein WCS15_11395 [Prevotella sp.]|nr:hypothetical protein [Prevotella sp.]MDT3386469.1 hypothetical protein [Bacteroidota bacterium]
MKKVFFSLIVMTLLSITAFAQETQSVEKLHRVYCELLGTQKFLSQKCNVSVDFGQNPYENSRLVDEKGKSITFNSMVDAMNYMGELGWKFEQAYVVTVASQNVYHWLLSKDISEDEAISSGFKTKSQLKKEQENQ